MEQNGWTLVYEEGPEGPRPAYWQHPSGATQRYTVTEGVGPDIPQPLQNWNIPGASVIPGTVSHEGTVAPTLSSLFNGKTPEQLVQEQGIRWGGVGQGSRTASGERVFTVDIGGDTYYLPESQAAGIPGAVEYIAQAEGKDPFGWIVPAMMAGVGGLALSGAGLGGAASVAGDLGSAAFPLDAATISGMNGVSGGATVGAGSLGSNLTSYPLESGIDPFGDLFSSPVSGAASPTSSGGFDLEELMRQLQGTDMGTAASGVSTALEGTNAAQAASIPFQVQNLLGSVPGLQSILGGSGTGSYQFPWGDVIGSVLEMYGSSEQANTLRDLMQQAINSDLWRAQAPRYYEPLYEATTKGIGNTAYGQSITDATLSKLASQGYNFSGNAAHEVAKGLNAGTTDYVRAVTPLAMGRGESNAATALAPGIAAGTQGTYGALGYGLQSLAQGSQPTAIQQLRGTPRNQTLSELWSL